MARDPRYDILFEPVQIGPKTAKTRFYQPGHSNGMGRLRPKGLARMRGVKAEGGWAVVNTEHCGITPSSEMFPESVMTLWDDDDVKILARMADEVHEHDSLFGVQLSYSGGYHANRLGREVPIGPVSKPVHEVDPVQGRAFDKSDIKQIHIWWRNAIKRAVRAGGDIINVNGQFSSMAFHLMSPRNRRTDEYGGSSIENRTRFFKELMDIARDVTQGELAITCRIIIEEFMGDKGLQAHSDGREMIEHLAELPDLWDVLCGDWEADSPPSRFAPENVHEPLFSFMKSVTTKPVVSVGRFTSPDTMASLIKRGVLDMIGCARPSIADPFLPQKIEQGRIEDSRECIGCNMCGSGHFTGGNYRCTQNPTAGEEWRRGWHPERIASKGSDDSILVVGAGPAGLEATRTLGERGYQVTLAEALDTLGGRVTRESQMPGLAEWARVRDWRVGQIQKMLNVEVYRASHLSAAEVLEFGFNRVVIATGASWRGDGYGRIHDDPIPGAGTHPVFTPDQIMAGEIPSGPVVVFDDDHYYMGSMMAEIIARAGQDVALVTPSADISEFSRITLEHHRVAHLLGSLGVDMITHHKLVEIGGNAVSLEHMLTGNTRELGAAAVVMVTARTPNDALYHELMSDEDVLREAGIHDVTRIGDCLAPGAIVHATFSGHRFGRELDQPEQDRQFDHELPVI